LGVLLEENSIDAQLSRYLMTSPQAHHSAELIGAPRWEGFFHFVLVTRNGAIERPASWKEMQWRPEQFANSVQTRVVA
jgi:hypothetical protein